MHDPIDETALVAALKAGEEWAFELMVRTFGGRLLAVARRFVRNEEDARDVVQSAYLSAFRSLEQFEGTAQLSTWLHRIVVNTALMRLRSRRRKPEESIEDLLPSFVEDGHHVEQFSDWAAPADVLIERSETRRTVRACVDQLPTIPIRAPAARHRRALHTGGRGDARHDADRREGAAAPRAPGALDAVAS